MPIQPTNMPRTYSGAYENIRLDFTPEPPEPRERWSRFSANYPTHLAWLRIYLDGEEALPTGVPSAHCFALFVGLLKAIPQVRAGKSGVAHWQTDPWRIDLTGDPVRDKVVITVHWPNHMAPLNKAEVPLGGLVRQVITVSRRWLTYINGTYHEETTHPKLGELYRQFQLQLLEAERAAK